MRAVCIHGGDLLTWRVCVSLVKSNETWQVTGTGKVGNVRADGKQRCTHIENGHKWMPYSAPIGRRNRTGLSRSFLRDDLPYETLLSFVGSGVQKRKRPLLLLLSFFHFAVLLCLSLFFFFLLHYPTFLFRLTPYLPSFFLASSHSFFS